MRLSDQVGEGWTALMPTANADIQGTRWRGASQTLRSMQSWVAGIGSPVSDLPRAEQRVLRGRSRDAYRSHMVARAALTRCRTNIVGTGLICRPGVDQAALGLTEDEADALNATLLRSWERWAEDPVECDIEATLDIYGQQGLALISAMLSGDVFALTPEYLRPGGVSSLKIQFVEADRVSNPFERSDSTHCIDGIEFNEAMPVGCWIRNTHPGDRHTSVMPAWKYYAMFGENTGRRRVLHIWNEKDRPGQVRGAPYLAPILEPLKQIERYGTAELMAAVVSAMLTVFIERDSAATDTNGDPIGPFAEAENANGDISLGNAAVVDLGPGEKANLANPARPNANFDPFFMAVVKQIGAALELPVDELLLHYEASYSAARAAMLQAWRFYTMRRWFLVQQFCQPIYGLHLDEEVASGRLSLPGYSDPIKRRAYSRAMWIGPARGSMDEYKEAKAAEVRIDIGVSNEAMETAAMTGEDWNTVYKQRAREIAQRRTDNTYSPRTATEMPVDPTIDGNPAKQGNAP
jgi:lambda family phage portal protein